MSLPSLMTFHMILTSYFKVYIDFGIDDVASAHKRLLAPNAGAASRRSTERALLSQAVRSAMVAARDLSRVCNGLEVSKQPT